MFSFNRNNVATTYWSYPYQLIQNCNLVLNSIDKIAINENDEDYDDLVEYRNDLKGQALAIRGMALFDLTRLYGYPYKKDNGASLGVPIIEELVGIDSKPARNTVAECYTKVIEYLKEAIDLLNADFNKGKFNRWAAMGLLSRVYLYHGDDALALQMAEDAIEGAEKKKYALWSNEEYPRAWGNDADKSNPGEVLLEIVNLSVDSPGKESMGYLNSKSGYDDMGITPSFYHLLKEDPDDIRLELLVDDKKRFVYVNKYQAQPNEAIYDANIPLIRLSEIYLNAAEAAVKTNDNDKAVKYLDAIVSRANPDNTVEGTTITLDRVMKERRKELVAEGHRMFDALRDGGKVDRSDETDDYLYKASDYFHIIDFDWTYYKCVLPIPKKEMDANKNMKQNPDYGE